MKFKNRDKRNGIGFLYWGERVVKRGGIIKWDHGTYQSDKLIDWEGERVEVQFDGNDIWVSGPLKIMARDWRHSLICVIDRSLESEMPSPSSAQTPAPQP